MSAARPPRTCAVRRYVALLTAVGAVLCTAITPSAMAQSPHDDEDRNGLHVVAGPKISAAEFPNAIQARRFLRTVRARLPVGSCRWNDVDFVLRLADRYLQDGVPIGRRMAVARTLRVNAWWFRKPRLPLPVRGLTLRDPEGVLSTYWECRGFAVNPVATTGRWKGLNSDFSNVELARVMLPMATGRRAAGRTFFLWEYFDDPNRPGMIQPGASGMAQGRLAELFARAYIQTGDRRMLAASSGALRAFTVSVPNGGVRSMVSFPFSSAPSPWFVERAFRGENPWRGAALNGFMVSILNLRDTAQILRKTPAGGEMAPQARASAQLADSLAGLGVDTLVRYLPLHDSGSWSYYGMLPSGRPWRTYLAPLNYHCYHIALLRNLDRAYPERRFVRWQKRWQRYVDVRGLTCL